MSVLPEASLPPGGLPRALWAVVLTEKRLMAAVQGGRFPGGRLLSQTQVFSKAVMEICSSVVQVSLGLDLCLLGRECLPLWFLH